MGVKYCSVCGLNEYQDEYCEAHWRERVGRFTPQATRQPLAFRRVDLTPWLDGTWEPPQPAVGAFRDDSRYLLYPGMWHSCDAPTGLGKSWFAVTHARDEILNAKRSVVYLHFEEELPGGTVARLLATGLPTDMIKERFVWLANTQTWDAGHLEAELQALEAEGHQIGLLIIDGRNAVCSRHGKDPMVTETVGWFKSRLVLPATRRNIAVLSLGHPVKDRSRQGERHSYGSTAWLDELDGVAFRLLPSKHPVRKGHSGTANLYSVKDRYGEVEKFGIPYEKEDGWYYLGSLVVDDAELVNNTKVRISQPSSAGIVDEPGDAIDALTEEIVQVLKYKPDSRYSSERQLQDWLRAAKVSFANGDVGPALERLETRGLIRRGVYFERKPRPGWLTNACSVDLEETS